MTPWSRFDVEQGWCVLVFTVVFDPKIARVTVKFFT